MSISLQSFFRVDLYRRIHLLLLILPQLHYHFDLIEILLDFPLLLLQYPHRQIMFLGVKLSVLPLYRTLIFSLGLHNPTLVNQYFALLSYPGAVILDYWYFLLLDDDLFELCPLAFPELWLRGLINLSGVCISPVKLMKYLSSSFDSRPNCLP